MKHRFEVLDIFRGLFSAMVVFFHMAYFAQTPLIQNNFVLNSDLFVDFFFVLSGFVIAYTYQALSDTVALGTFYKRRLQRLYPLHLLMLLVFVGMEFVKHHASMGIQVNQPNNDANNWTSFFSSLLLLNSVKLPNVHDVSWNIPSWSISAEFISYLLFGFLVVLMNRMGLARAKTLVYVLVSCVAFGGIVLFTGKYDINYSFDYGFLRGITGFFAGACCLNIFMAVRDRGFRLSAGVFHVGEVVCMGLIGYVVWNGFAFKSVGFVYELVFMLAILVFAFEKGVLSGLLKRSGFLKRMGAYSYSIYMTHAFLLSVFNIVFIRVLHFSPKAYSYLFVVNYALIYFVSAWTYKHIEMRFAGKKKPKQVISRASVV